MIAAHYAAGEVKQGENKMSIRNIKHDVLYDLQKELLANEDRILYIQQQLASLPKRLENEQLNLKNLKDLIKEIENTNSFTDPIFEYVQEEND